MNLISKIKGMKLAALLVAAMTCFAAGAANRVYVEPFNIVDETPVDVPVLMDNDVDIMSLQFRIDLPAELELVGPPERTDRLKNGQEITFQGVGVVVLSMEGKPVAGNSGAIMTLKVKAKDGMLENKVVSFGLSKIVMGDTNNKKVQNSTKESVDVTLGEQPEYVFSASQPEAVVSAGTTFPVEVCLSNNFALGGMQFRLTMPEGFDVVNTDIKLSNRLSLGTRLYKTVRPDGSIKFVVCDRSRVKIADAGEGPIFILYVSVPEGYNDYEGKITVSDVVASTVPSDGGATNTVSVDCKGFEVKIVNGGRYLSDAETVVAGLRADLAAALATIAAEAADVKDNFTGADITAAIEAIETAAREAAANGTLPTEYAAVVTDPAAAVSRSIEQLVADAKTAQKAFEDEAARKAANEAAYQASLAEIQRLTDKLNEMEQTAAASYPDATVDTQVAAAQAALDKAKAEADAARAAVADEGNYSYAVDTAAIEALIKAVGDEAAKQQAAADAEKARVAANEAAHKAVLDEIAALQASLDATKAAAAENYPDADVDKQVAAAQAALDKAKTEAAAAKAAVKDEGNYSYAVDKATIEALITAVTNEAAKQQAAVDAEKARVAANEAAHKAVLDEIAALQASLDATKAAAAENYPDADVDKQVAAAQAALDKAKADAEAAKAAVKDEGNYSYAVDKATIEALITAVTNEAARDQAAKDAEAKRVADNEAAYKASIDEIAALQAALDAMKTKVAATYPAANVTAETVAAQSAIDKAEAGANAAKSAVILEGNYSYTVDTEGITALINAIETAAEAQRVAANEAAYQATLAEIQRLTDKLDNMKALIATTYPDVNVDEAIAAAAAAIEAAKNGAADALAAVKDEGNYSYTVDAAAIEALIDAIRTAAAEAQAVLDKENARVEANQAAYEEAIAQIDALQAALDAMKANVEENYPDADVTAEIEAAQAAIDNARSEAEDALEAVAEEGTFAYSPDTDSVDALIAAIETAAKAAGIVNIEADAAKGILYYDINGRRVINPERGMVVIRLTPDGQVTKIIL